MPGAGVNKVLLQQRARSETRHTASQPAKERRFTIPPYFSGFRASVARGLHWSDSHAMLLWAALAGVVGASATIAFREGISGLQWLMVGKSESLGDMARNLDWPLRIAIPTLGGVVAGLLLAWARRTDSGEAKPDYMEAIAIGDGRIPVLLGAVHKTSLLDAYVRLSGGV